MRRFLFGIISSLGLLLSVQAQEAWPSRSVTIVVPYSAGTAPDIIARLLGDQLSKRFNQPVIVDNRAGAGGIIGAEYAASAKKDGYTLFLGTIDTQAIISHLNKNLKYNPETAFVPISILGRIANIVAASPDLKVGNFRSLIAQGKGAGKSFTFATPGTGTSLHLLGELVAMKTGIKLVHVPYKSASAGYLDAIAGRIDLVVAGLPPLAPLLQEKKLNALVTTAAQRLPNLPDVPTMSEMGYSDIAITNWFGLLAPAGVSEDIIRRVNSDAQEIARSESYSQKMKELFIEPISSSPAEFERVMKEEYSRMGDIVRRAGISID